MTAIVCPFCNPELIKSEKVIEKEGCLIFEPLDPVVEGHLLVVPKAHVKDFTESPKIAAAAMYTAARHARELGGNYNLITSKGIWATQSVMHLHIHLVPRKPDDGLKLPWSEQ